jgi:uncharacterized membrane protein YfcA
MEFKLIFPLMILAFVCELVDSSLGMGYGTTLTPILLIAGYEPIEVVPAVLFSECITGLVAGVLHHEFGNVNFRRGTRDTNIALLLTGLSIVGVLIAVVLAVNVPAWIIKLYIGIVVLGIGLNLLKRSRKGDSFSWKKLMGLGLLAAFNKGISGGGYGPVVTGGQILAGIRGRSAVAIASLAEGVTSAVGLIVYMISGTPFPWQLGISMLIGAVLSTPIAAYAVSRIPAGRLTFAIGTVSTVIGGYTLAKVFL